MPSMTCLGAADHEVREVVQRYERRIWGALNTLTTPST
jgi:hypothetical protein